jgi:hypothetical protein
LTRGQKYGLVREIEKGLDKLLYQLADFWGCDYSQLAERKPSIFLGPEGKARCPTHHYVPLSNLIVMAEVEYRRRPSRLWKNYSLPFRLSGCCDLYLGLVHELGHFIHFQTDPDADRIDRALQEFYATMSQYAILDEMGIADVDRERMFSDRGLLKFTLKCLSPEMPYNATEITLGACYRKLKALSPAERYKLLTDPGTLRAMLDGIGWRKELKNEISHALARLVMKRVTG